MRNRNGLDAEIADKLANKGDSRMWSVNGDCFFPCEKTEESLPAGQYLVQHSDQRGIFFVKKTVNLDELVVLPDSRTERVLASINNFWQREPLFRKHGFLWKRGVLLWGPPGSGKTSCIQQLSNQIIDAGGMSVYCTVPQTDAEGLRILRKIEPKRQIVVMIEDIDAIVEHFGESDLLAMLDGELQIDNVVFIATTNYPEDLDARFVNRPSRFDEVIYIGMPKEQAREQYLISKNSRLQEKPEELKRWVAMSKGFSIAQLKEMIVGVECLGANIEEVVKRLREMCEKRPTSGDSDDKKSFGFRAMDDDI